MFQAPFDRARSETPRRSSAATVAPPARHTRARRRRRAPRPNRGSARRSRGSSSQYWRVSDSACSRAIVPQPGCSRRKARLASHAKGGTRDEILIVNMIVPRKPAIAIAARRYRFHRRLAARMPQPSAVRARRDAGKLSVGVVHMEDFIAQNLVEYSPRLGSSSTTPDRLRSVQQQSFPPSAGKRVAIVGFVFDTKIVQAVAARQRRSRGSARPRVAAAGGRRRARGTASPWWSSSIAWARYSRRSNGSRVTSAARKMSRPPPVSTSAKVSSLRTRLSESLQIHLCRGRRS